jgi:hypothetical protein
MKSWVERGDTSSPVGTADPRESRRGVQPALRDLILTRINTQEFILSYKQPSLRDLVPATL